jgi:hypothetical protein
MAVTLSIANHHASLPIIYRRRRNGPRTAVCRKKAHVPKAIAFKTKLQIALEPDPRGLRRSGARQHAPKRRC